LQLQCQKGLELMAISRWAAKGARKPGFILIGQAIVQDPIHLGA
jgi:hypothetical protein